MFYSTSDPCRGMAARVADPCVWRGAPPWAVGGDLAGAADDAVRAQRELLFIAELTAPSRATPRESAVRRCAPRLASASRNSPPRAI